MKLLILSDSHGYLFFLEQILQRERDADMIIHLGDGGSDLLSLPGYTADKPIYHCRGNCDSAADGFPDFVLTEAEGVRIFACHGHRYGVKYGLQNLYFAAREQNAKLCLFGHTHLPHSDYDGHLYMVNPGPAGGGYYAVAELHNGEITTVNRSLQKKP